jgi:sugar phosphate isomerase/epimerase
METRRVFIKKTSMVAAGGLLLPQVTFKSAEKSSRKEGENGKVIGIQIYTLRNKIRNDLEGSLKVVADTGYKNIEAYGYGNRMILGKSPEEFRKLVEGLGMKMPSIHTVTELTSDESIENILDAWKITVEDMHTAGTQYLVYAMLPPSERRNLDDYKKWAERFNLFGEISRDAGMQFGYHNHDFEFIEFDGEKGYDLLLKQTDPDLVIFEPDLFWMTKASEDPLTWFEKYPGRFELWHIKDMEDSEERTFTEVGSGIIDFQRIFKARDTAGMKLFFVEQDKSRMDEFESIKISFDYLNKAAFV